MRRARLGRLVAAALAMLVAGAVPASAATSTTWKLSVSGNPAGAVQVYLDGVSCTGPTTIGCFAVGTYISSVGSVRTLIERWNGTRWVIVASPNHAGAISNSLVAVSCTSTKNCFAVGNWQAGPTTAARTLVERWNGTAWSIVASPNPAGATGSFLHAVSCIVARCYAVGSYTSGGTGGSTLTERWNGTAWTILASPNAPRAAVNTLDGVSCFPVGTAVNCFAVGSSATSSTGDVPRTLTERWTGAKWVVVASPNYGGIYKSALMSVSCTSAKFCIAVGAWSHAPGASLSERWNGTKWAIVAVRSPVGFTFSQLNSVSCTTVTNCIAVGSWAKGTAVNTTLVARFNGTAWTLLYSPNPAGSKSSSLAGVSCVGLKCSAAGTYLKPVTGASTALAERNF